MWSDNETINDLLGFRVHSDLIHSVVTDNTLLPVVIGVFGDWGGGKSSIMRMLEGDLEDRDGIVCLYFNGWMFEGYEDAKTALLTSILMALGEHKQLKEQLKDKVASLLRRVQWMEIGRSTIKHVGVPVAAGLLTGGVATIPAAMAMAATSATDAVKKAASGNSEESGDAATNWLDRVLKAPDKPDLLEVRKFRDDFEKMLADTDIQSLVILIDDLDRCLPPRIIETLEAIKLFVAVPKTAFVIGADERIVRHAIATRYARHQIDLENLDAAPDEAEEEREKPYDLTTDYLEKLIQVPYHLPRLSPAEMETYINLLLCQKSLLPHRQSDYESLLENWNEKRQANLYSVLNQAAVEAVLGTDQIPADLVQQLQWSNRVARALTEGLKGNPRQVKRMLNAMLLRTKLAKVAQLEIKPDVLAKLMVLEYTRPELFRKLSDWQTASNGHPPELQQLEEKAVKDEKHPDFPKWHKPGVHNWLQMDPLLAPVDLRDYFWIARDRTKSTLAAASMVSPHVNALYRALIGGNEGEKETAANQAKDLEAGEIDSLLFQLEQYVTRRPDEDNGSEALAMLIGRSVEGAESSLFEALRQASAETMSPSTPGRLQIIVAGRPDLKDDVDKILDHLAAKSETPVGRAAAGIRENKRT